MDDLPRRLNDVRAMANGGRLLDAETAWRTILAAAPAFAEATAS